MQIKDFGPSRYIGGSGTNKRDLMDQPTHRLPSDLASLIFSGFTRQTTLAVIIADLQPTRILYMNPAARELWDADNPERTEGLDRLILKIHREDRNHTLAKINRYLTETGPTAWSSG
jgi:PAS domain-containing protein